MKSSRILWLVTLVLFATTSTTWGQNCPVNGGMAMPGSLPGIAGSGMTPPPHHSQIPSSSSRTDDGRPSMTATGVPIRYVDVPVPRNAGCYNGYAGYGYGGYGYGYGGYGYGGYSYGIGSATPINQPSQRSTRSSAARVSQPAPPDPRSARNYELRKALNKFARENSVGGRLYVAYDSKKWLLEYDGTPSFDEDTVTIPCIGKAAGGSDHRLTLTLRFDQLDDVTAEVGPRG